MSLGTQIWCAVWVVIATLAVIRLLHVSRRPEPAVRNGFRWLAGAVVFLCAGGVIQQAFGGLVGGAQPLRIADLVILIALAALLIGLATLTDDSPRENRGIAADSALIAMSLFVILFATVFGPAYVHTGAASAAFALALVRPVADLVALGLATRFVVRTPRSAMLPALAIASLSVADALAVSARLAGADPGTSARAGLAVSLVLLALMPAAVEPVPVGAGGSGVITGGVGAAQPARAAPAAPDNGMRSNMAALLRESPATVVALACASAAGLATAGAVGSGRATLGAGLAVPLAIMVLLLVLRLVTLAGQAMATVASARDAERRFRVLAEAARDVVAVCDPAGVVEYVSPAIADFGFTAERLVGTCVTDLMHPQDRPVAVRSARTSLRKARAEEFAGRVRSADGSWRHVEATISPYASGADPVRLLVTARDVTDRVALRRQVTQLTYHDGITGLPNRAYMEDQVKDLRESGGHGQTAGMILIDLDGYTAVNDLLGHSGGDVVLAQAGRRIRTAAPAGATVARWGADEFAVLIADPVSEDEAAEMARRLARRISSEPFEAAAKEIPLTASVGVAVAGRVGIGDLLGNAHIALSRAKESGGNQVEVFAARMHARARHRLELASDLHQALTERRLAIDYQPVTELASGAVVAVEAVVCWSRQGELISDGELLEIAEDAGVAGQIGDWVLDEACRQVAAGRSSGEPITLSVNCSARQVRSPDFAACVRSALAISGLPPRALTIEVTEGLLIDDGGESAPSALADLRAAGVRLAIDEFGTGRASLANLSHLAVDAIKVAPSFTAGLGIDSRLTLLTRTIIELGGDLDIGVIAAGIQTPQQRDELLRMGCKFGQGPALGGQWTAPDGQGGRRGDPPSAAPDVTAARK